METLWHDLRFGIRMLAKSPGFTAVAVIALALGIGTNTAIFSVVNAVLLRPLPYQDPERLLIVWANNTREGKPRYPISPANFVDLRDQNQAFEQVAAYSTFIGTTVMTGRGEPRGALQSMVSPNLFALLGVDAALGRTFLLEEGQIGRDQVVLLSHGFWQRHLDSDPGIVGKTLTLGGNSYTVVGVMPRGFYFLQREIDLWLPLSFNARYHPSLAITNRGGGGFGVIGRLKPGLTMEQARANLTAIARRLEQQYPEVNKGLGATVLPLHEQVVGEIRQALWVLFGAVGFVLLIACANVATLLLARARSRAKEVAVRAALGAGRLRLVRQLLTESVLLAVVGGGLGLVLSFWGIPLLLAFSPSEIPRQTEIGINAWVLGFTLAVSVLTGVVFGLAPALQASKTDLHETLKEGGRTSAGSARHRLSSLLVVSEIALTLVLLVGAGLFVRSFIRLMRVDPGFNPENLLTMQIAVPQSQNSKVPQMLAYYDELFKRIEALPGVQAVGAATRLPLMPRNGVTSTLTIEGRPVPAAELPEIEFRRASTNYFRAMGIPLLKGRYFTAQDTPQVPPVAIITESAARRFWPNENPVDQHIKTFSSPNAPWLTIVGVVGDVRHFGLDSDARPEVYIASGQAPPSGPFMVVRTASDPLKLAAAVRAQVQAMNPDQPTDNIQTMSQVLTASVAQRRFNMLLLGFFAGLALLLAAVGIYGLMSYTVTQRTHEIGIRMALGAQRRDIVRLVVGRGLVLALSGVGVGLAGAFALTHLASRLLFKVSATDPVTFVSISLLLTIVALVACYLPARKATKVDPMVALRYE